jgi:hypothetical protein
MQADSHILEILKKQIQNSVHRLTEEAALTELRCRCWKTTMKRKYGTYSAAGKLAESELEDGTDLHESEQQSSHVCQQCSPTELRNAGSQYYLKRAS